MIQQRRTDRLVPTETDVMGKPGLVEVGVKRSGDGSSAIQLRLITAAIGEEELVAAAPVLVNAEGHSGVPLGINGAKNKVSYSALFHT